MLACSPRQDALERVRTTGVLRVAALNNAPYCHRGDDGVAGYECDLLQGFAKSLGVKLEVQFFDNAPLIIDAVRKGEAEIGAGGLPPLPAYRRFVRFGPPVRSITQQLVYNTSGPTPHDLSDVHGDLVVVADSIADRQLRALQPRYPSLQWDESHDDDIDALLTQVASDDLDYTVASSDVVFIARQHYPQLRAAFDLTDPEEQVWALPAQSGNALMQALQD
jgi:membrane-bound lytic murein transglycosylase F